MGFFNKYPYTDFHELNLDWVLQTVKLIGDKVDNFINFNTIKYADPIEWNITTQYQGNTVVIDNVNHLAYLSTKPVPAGVLLTDTDYWTPILDLKGFYDALGDLNSLNTIDKSTIVGAINEVLQNVNDIDDKNDIFIEGDYNITDAPNMDNEDTYVYWRRISKEYTPALAFDENGLDYAVKMANENGATCAVNAGRFTGSDFYGYFRNDGLTIHANDLVITDSLNILSFKEGKLYSDPITDTTESLDAKDYEWSLTGFETIIENGIYTNRADPDVYSNDFHPRSFIAQTDEGDYIIGCTDGRSSRTKGFALGDITRFLLSLGYNIDFAYSLDGGGSVTLCEKGSRVNSYINRENRKIKNVIYFKKDNAFYSDELKAKTSEINTKFIASLTNYLMQGDLVTYANLISSGTPLTAAIRYFDLATRTEQFSIRAQKDRLFTPFSDAFATGGTYNLIDISKSAFNYAGIARYIFNKTYVTNDYEDALPVNDDQTGVYKCYVSDSSVLTGAGFNPSEDAGTIIFLRIRTSSQAFDIIMTQTNIYYRFGGTSGTLKKLN